MMVGEGCGELLMNFECGVTGYTAGSVRVGRLRRMPRPAPLPGPPPKTPGGRGTREASLFA